jgi:hypothetical protein
MPRPCSICTHPQRHAIDAALTASEALRNMAPRFGTSVTALHRHKHEHLLKHLADVQQSHTPALRSQGSPPMPQAPPTPLSPEAQQALAAYRNAVHNYQSRQQLCQGYLPMDRSTILVPLALRVAHARQRLAALGITPETLEGWEHYGHDPHATRYCWRSMADSMRGPRGGTKT